jgi:hypothetical protein
LTSITQFARLPFRAAHSVLRVRRRRSGAGTDAEYAKAVLAFVKELVKAIGNPSTYGQETQHELSGARRGQFPPQDSDAGRNAAWSLLGAQRAPNFQRAAARDAGPASQRLRRKHDDEEVGNVHQDFRGHGNPRYQRARKRRHSEQTRGGPQHALRFNGSWLGQEPAGVTEGNARVPIGGRS